MSAAPAAAVRRDPGRELASRASMLENHPMFSAYRAHLDAIPVHGDAAAPVLNRLAAEHPRRVLNVRGAMR